MGGAGSGGGGGSSGTVDYPGYMKSHHNWAMNTLIRPAVLEAQANNPYLVIQAFSPDYMVRRMHAGLACFDKAIRSFDPFDVWKTLVEKMPEIIKNNVAPEMLDKFFKTPDVKGMFDPGEIDQWVDINWPVVLPLSDMDIFDPDALNRYLKTIPMDYFSDVTELNKFIDGQKRRLCETTREEVIPAYRRGMQDIGAVVSSAFKIGEALLWAKTIYAMADLEAQEKSKVAEMDKDYRGKMSLTHYDYMGKLALTEYESDAKVILNRHDYIGKHEILRSEKKTQMAIEGSENEAKLHLLQEEIRGKAALVAYEYMFRTSNDALQLVLQKIAYYKDVLHYFLEIERMAYTAWKEYTDTKNVYQIEAVKWNLEMTKYFMDSLGAIASSAGTSYTTSNSGTSKTASAIGGALTGASAGAMAGSVIPGVGTGIGAAVGAGVGLAASMF